MKLKLKLPISSATHCTENPAEILKGTTLGHYFEVVAHGA